MKCYMLGFPGWGEGANESSLVVIARLAEYHHPRHHSLYLMMMVPIAVVRSAVGGPQYLQEGRLASSTTSTALVNLIVWQCCSTPCKFI